jgi:hypothetical protein
VQKKDLAPEILLAQNQEIQQLMAHFQEQAPNGQGVQELEFPEIAIPLATHH